MSRAWLDSLSEDWVSQPRSDGSQPSQAPSQDASTADSSGPKAKPFESRLPRPQVFSKQQSAVSNDGNSSSSRVLSERSVNEIKTTSPRRGAPSKLSREVRVSEVSDGSAGSEGQPSSVVHNTIAQQKSRGPSAARVNGHTPEWRRRLVYGEVSYGEQRDLFTSVATGLENMFKPPAAPVAAASKKCGRGSAEAFSEVRVSGFSAAKDAEANNGSEAHHDVTFPSSPPFYRKDGTMMMERRAGEDASVEEAHVQLQKRAPTAMQYRRTDESEGDVEPSTRPDEASASLGADGAEPRKVSGQSDVRNEEFSAIMLMRRQASNGRASFVASLSRAQTDRQNQMAAASGVVRKSEVAANELRERLETLRRNQIVLADDSVQDGTSRMENGLDYKQLEGFVNVKRGGQSAEGSFRHRMLSSGLTDTSELLPEESLQASTPKQFPSVRAESLEFTASPDLPPAPKPSPEKRESQTKSQTIGPVSPLKLFQTHDTLTAKTLCTRLSQLETALSNGSRSASGNSNLARLNEFGAGKLDGYEFPEELSYGSGSCDASLLAGEDKERERSGLDDSGQLPSKPLFMVTAHSSSPLEDEDLVVHKQRGKSTGSRSTGSRPSTRDSRKGTGGADADADADADAADVFATPRRRDTGPESKRPRTSPSKDPTPKRRRTLHKSDISYEAGSNSGSTRLDKVQESHLQLQSAMMGRKRKDARQGDDAQGPAAPKVLAARQMLRPRTPTPNQRPPLAEMPVQVGEFAGGPSGPSGPSGPRVPVQRDTGRKPSIKTEDFINEANKIMAMIRTKAKLGGSGLASVNESNVEQQGHGPRHGQTRAPIQVESSYLESTREPLSRPPSREGGGALSRRVGAVGKRQQDPELVRHLQQYEEASDTGDLAGLGPIMRADEVSDPPNLRLSANPLLVRRSVESLRDGSTSSGPSTGPSTMPTGSSRGSESRRTIAPQSVSHLIGDRVGDMVLDKDQGRWVRKRPSEDSEGDAFAGIPDLSVDRTLEMQKLAAAAKARGDDDEMEVEAEVEVEHEIRLHEDRVAAPRRKHLTISFSSPIASFIQESGPDELTTLSEDERSISIKSQAKGPGPGPTRRHVSVGGRRFMARPVSRIEEERDEQDGRDEHGGGLEVSVLGDANCPVAAGLSAVPVISRHVGTLTLSPLADFTVHGHDISLPLEASYVVGDHRLTTGNVGRPVLSLETRDLVARLATVEPYEPYWEDMRTLALGRQALSSVHALDSFCRRLESLDASRNRIRNLSGVPAPVRRLDVSHNELSSLTSWCHLANLQYVDVSHNALTSLVALGRLVHLRSLRADNNRLTSIDGVKFHDGLQSLRARGNQIEHVDLEGTRLCQLTNLDLRDNRIVRAVHLDQLPALQSLDLEGNRLAEFSLPAPSPVLRYLRLGGNALHSLDVRNAPRLRLLHADANRLVRVAGLSRARRIDSLSLRDQQGDEPLDVAHLLSRAYEVRKLYLSGNLFPDPSTFAPPVDMLNLQLLELASCGLASLPPRLGHSLPNLRVLNLNFNALEDLAPLRGVPRLKRVLAAGNRIADAAALMTVLAEFEHLVAADLRGNPITLGFYHPTASAVAAVAAAPSSSSLVSSSCPSAADPIPMPNPDFDLEPDDHGHDHDPFVLPDQDPARDAAFASRLHLQTRMRRRLHETVARTACRRLRRIDGLPLPGAEGRRRSEEDSEMVHDVVWEALEDRGLVCVQKEHDVHHETRVKVCAA